MISVSPTKSSSTWLDRCSGELTGVLCDLFNMGESSRTFSKKTCRKQANPRFCGANSSIIGNENELCSSDDLRREKSDNGLASSGDNSNNNGGGGDLRVDDDVEDEENVDLKAYSRNEVTVIDTSFKEWKSDNWVFRKNDEWKIKEKRSKSRVFGGKKRKLGNDQKKENEESLPPNYEGQPLNDKDREPFKETADFLDKAPQKRFPCPRPPEKFKNEGSRVILIKSVPFSNSNEATRLGKRAHKKRPKQMKIV